MPLLHFLFSDSIPLQIFTPTLRFQIPSRPSEQSWKARWLLYPATKWNNTSIPPSPLVISRQWRLCEQMWAIGRFQLWGCLWQSWCHRNTFTIYLTDIEKPRCSQFFQNVPLSLTVASIPCKIGTPTPRGRRAKRSERGLYWNWSLRLSYYPKRLKESLQEGSY